MIKHDFMDKPIPDLSDLRSDRLSWRKHPICPAPETCGRIVWPLFYCSYYWDYKPRPEGAMEDIFLRQRIIIKLKRINQSLRSLGLQLLIQEGYRPISVQRFVQEVSVLKFLRKENPSATDEELRGKIVTFAASMNGDFDVSPPPHMTGGAVDLTLAYSNTREQVEMGKKGGLYNTAFPDALESLGPEFEEARQFRRLLYWLAKEQNMAVNPFEWWHLSWGDQMWAWIFKAPYAMYGVANERYFG